MAQLGHNQSERKKESRLLFFVVKRLISIEYVISLFT